MSRVAKRYAKALFLTVQGDSKEARKILLCLEVLAELFENAESGKILNSPVMPRGLKRDLLEYGLKIGEADAKVAQVVDYLLEARRETVIPKLVKAFRELIDSAEGIARGQVTSVLPLGEDEIRLLKAELKHLLHKDVELKEAIDPSLLGGMVAKVGHFLLDMSLKTRLDEIGQHVIQSQVQNTAR